MRYKDIIPAGLIALTALAGTARAFTVNPVTKDISSLSTNFTDTTSPIKPVRTGFDNNVVQKFTIADPGTATKTGGSSFVLAVSNGENGIDGGPDPGNVDIDRMVPVGAAIDIANGGDGTQGHKIQNGNAFRFSVWMQQDPANPVTYEPSVEPTLKFEIWKESQSTNGDYVGQELWSTFGDRLWDTDINASLDFFKMHNQSQASHIDIDGNGTYVGPDASTPDADGSIPPASGVQWQRFETTLIIDDDPDGTGQGWVIFNQRYKVDAIEEIRATFFVGDYFGAPPAGGGSFFVDNALLEVFPNQEMMDMTPNPNPMPIAATVGDYNDDGKVDAADYTVWRDNLGKSAAALANRDPNVTGLVKAGDYTAWKTHYGQGGGGGGASIIGYAPAAVPEPGTLVLALLGMIGAAAISHRN
jgi:PEP-CTERM motif